MAETILVEDDEDANRELSEAILSEAGTRYRRPRGDGGPDTNKR